MQKKKEKTIFNTLFFKFHKFGKVKNGTQINARYDL